MSLSVSLSAHSGKWSNARDYSSQLKQDISSTFAGLNEYLDDINVYFMKEIVQNFDIGSQKTIYVLAGATPNQSTKVSIELGFKFGGNYMVELNIPNNLEGFETIEDVNGVTYAFITKNKHNVYITADFSDLDAKDFIEIIKETLEKVYEKRFKNIKNKKSWILSDEKEKLKQDVITYLSRDKEARLRDAKDKYESFKRKIRSYQEELHQLHKKHIEAGKRISEIELNEVAGLDNFMKGLDLIAQYPNVSDLKVDTNKISISIDGVYANAYVKGQDRRYYIGNMRIDLDMNNSSVKFYGDNPRKSYWTENDPHPHVNGDDNYACLGNVSTTIAELCSQKEIYPLFLICLDFLQNANTEDIAGANIVHWDEVDDEGNIIKEGGEEEEAMFYCEDCGDPVYEGESEHEVYTMWNSSREQFENAEMWCESCADNNAVYNDEREILVAEYAQYDYNEWLEAQEEEEDYEDEEEEDEE